MRGFSLAILALAFGAVLLSCGEPSPIAPPPPTVECSGEGESAQLWGRWKLDFGGARQGCDDPVLDQPFAINPALEFELYQHDDAEAGLARLELSRPVEAFRFSGEVEGQCVRFSLSESKPGGQGTKAPAG